MKLDDKMLATFLSDAKVFDLWKDLADAGGMLVPYGIKDAAHLKKIIHKAAADLREAHWKETINKHRSEPIPKKPNPKPASKKSLPTLGQVKRANWRPKKKKDALNRRLPGHYGANQ